MIAIFFVGAVVALPQIAQATGVEINSFADIWNIFNSNVGSGSGNPNAEPYTIGGSMRGWSSAYRQYR